MTNQPTTDFSGLPYIVAVDFDGTLVHDAFPQIGNERPKMCSFIRKLHKVGIKLILWTSRTGEYLDEALQWCEEHKLYFDKVNENLDEVQALVGEDTRKVYANVYIDDRSCSAYVQNYYYTVGNLTEWLENK